MSTLSVTTINTANGTTDLTVASGNASAGELVFPSTGGVYLQPNSSANVLVSTATGNVGIGVSNVISISSGGNTTISGNTTITGNTTFSANATVAGRIGIGNTTPATSLQITGNYSVSAQTIATGNNHNVNCALGNYFVITANSSAQNVYFTSAPSGTVYGMTIRFANGGGGNTISWANTPKWPGSTAPTPSTNNDIWVFLTDDGGTTWRGNQVQKDSR
jgi:hypothetical protein